MSDNNNEIQLEPIKSEDNDLDIDIASYKINTYGADFTLELLSKKLDDAEILVPSFQRRYVWNTKKASKLIESFLLGLPVPQIFLFRQEDTQDLMVVDGQQRLKSINYFFKERYEDGSRFSLVGVKSQWEGKVYSDLSEQDKRKFKNSILRATIFEQTDPADNSSVFEIFERLNTGGMALTPQEIRNCVINGPINKFLENLNKNAQWRKLLGKPDPDSRMKDIEMLVRFFALYENWAEYTKPMKDFINTYMEGRKDITEEKQNELSQLFQNTINFIFSELGENAFRIKSGINVAVFDSVMTSISLIGTNKITNAKESYERLLKIEAYKEAVSEHTTDVEKVQGRIKMAITEFSK